MLQGMVNCFHVCHANFEDTVGMVGSTRGIAPEEVKEILSRLREADVEHSEDALNLIDKYSVQLNMTENVQATFLRSIHEFDKYLMARLERGKQFEGS